MIATFRLFPVRPIGLASVCPSVNLPPLVGGAAFDVQSSLIPTWYARSEQALMCTGPCTGTRTRSEPWWSRTLEEPETASPGAHGHAPFLLSEGHAPFLLLLVEHPVRKVVMAAPQEPQRSEVMLTLAKLLSGEICPLVASRKKHAGILSVKSLNFGVRLVNLERCSCANCSRGTRYANGCLWSRSGKTRL